jgi:hypothetical protein
MRSCSSAACPSTRTGPEGEKGQGKKGQGRGELRPWCWSRALQSSRQECSCGQGHGGRGAAYLQQLTQPPVFAHSLDACSSSFWRGRPG